MIIHLIAAARPNFMKIAPLYHALKQEPWAHPIIVHTGQHYDLNMSDTFFEDLALPKPDIYLGVGSGTHAEQTGRVMMAYEKVLLESRPDLVVVVGDVNSTMATTIAAVKLSVKVAHLEAGLRSFDRTMPEEINRIVTDTLADILWTPSPDADENLIAEGVNRDKIHCVGNIMIDSLEMMRPKIENDKACKRVGLNKGDFGIVTLHRPANVDDHQTLQHICDLFISISKKIPFVFPVHPRTFKNLNQNNLMAALKAQKNIFLLEPLNYISFMNLVFNCRLAVTDSGGIQEETTYLGIPCLTMRPNTERPITVEQGTNQLCTVDNLENLIDDILNGKAPKGTVPDLWDGRTAARIVKQLREC